MAAGTRASARLSQGSSPQSAEGAGMKRKADEASPSGTKAKRGRPSNASKQQKTLEETMPDATDDNDAEDEGFEDGDANGEATEQNGSSKEESTTKTDGPKDGDGAANAFDQVKAGENEAGTTTKEDDAEENQAGAGAGTEGGDVKVDAVEEDQNREDMMPSNILEKGVIYFFTRGRVGTENPESVQDLQRSYFVLRPLPDGAKITDGVIPDVGNNRLIAVPKKVWPKSGKDRFMCAVEKANTTMTDLKETFFQGSDYSTQTMGTRHTPEVTPLGEGVYAMTTSGGGQGTTHLAYMLTIPSELGEVQKDVGLKDRGSFVLSIKNPESSSGNGVQLPTTAEYPRELLDEFQGRAWNAAHPKFLDYQGTSMLLIGEDFDSSANLDPKPKDEKDDTKETPQEELEKLEDEDELRVEHLKGDDTIFADLGISSKDYPKVMTTW